MEYQNLIFTVLMTVFTSCFYQDLMQNNHLLYSWKIYLNTLPLYLGKPLGLCVVCSTVWLSIIIGFFVGINLIIPNIILSHQLIKKIYNES